MDQSYWNPKLSQFWNVKWSLAILSKFKSTWIFPHKYRNHNGHEAWDHLGYIPIPSLEISSKRKGGKPVRRQFGVSANYTGPVICGFPEPVWGEKLRTRTSGDQRNEEAGFRHLPGTWGNFTLEHQNAKAGPGHTAQSQTVTGGQIFGNYMLNTHTSH